jgi:hypothetical protein
LKNPWNDIGRTSPDFLETTENNIELLNQISYSETQKYPRHIQGETEKTEDSR